MNKIIKFLSTIQYIHWQDCVYLNYLTFQNKLLKPAKNPDLEKRQKFC